MAQTSDTPLELDPDTLALDALAHSTHPPLILPKSAFSVDPQNPLVLGFAPAPTGPATRPLPAAVPEDILEDRAAAVTRPKGQFRVNWYEAAIIALMLGCAALCVYRLLWAV